MPNCCHKCDATLVGRYPGGDPENGPARLTCPRGHAPRCGGDGCTNDGVAEDGSGPARGDR